MLTLNQAGKLKLDDFMQQALDKGVFPGAVLGVVNQHGVLYQQAFGYRQLEPEKLEMTQETVFDIASLTKVLATTTAIMCLIEAGQINLWDPLKRFYPELPADKEQITIMHLMTHTSGYQAIVRLWDLELTNQEKIEHILHLPLEYPMGTKVVYSDPNYILLGDLVQRVSGQSLDQFVEKTIFSALGMTRTVFNPVKKLPATKEIAATEWCSWRQGMIVGQVHDENAASFAGVSGHAGLFSVIEDLCVFLQMLLNDGMYDQRRFLSPQTIKQMRSDWTAELNQHRGLGWDLVKNAYSSGGVLLSQQGFGHTGFTGTSLWIDPELHLAVVLLTNRVHPSRENTKIIAFRPRLHNLIVASLVQN